MRVWAVLLLAWAGCTPGQIGGPRDTGLDGLFVTRVEPRLLLPGTRVAVTGRSFVDESLGETRLRLQGTLRGAAVNLALDARYLSGAQLELSVTDEVALALGGLEGSFDGQATVEVDSTVDGRTHASPAYAVKLDLAAVVQPQFDAIGDGLSFVNHPIEVAGNGFLLGGAEGETRARISGCFTPVGQSACEPSIALEIPAVPLAPFDRTRLTFPYLTRISGIGPGTFAGSVRLVNVHSSGDQPLSRARAVRFDIQRPAIFAASTARASLGQYVVIQGGGFTGGATDEYTLLQLTGNFQPRAPGAQARALDLQLVPEFVSGPTLRYVVAERPDPLGSAVDLRKEFGTLTGTIKPIVAKGAVRIEGSPVPMRLEILPVKQVVYVNFLPSFVASLRKFGLRAADPLIRARVLEIAARDYAGANVEFREAPPEDFAQFAQVDIAGPDPNGFGLLGYDNSPGKDTGNVRLYDRIGGVNATTQQDGFPGFGGVFTESFFGFSQHPNGIAKALPQANTRFDRLFDPFRPDQGGLELTATELARLAPPLLENGGGCPAPDRTTRIACAVFTLGNLIGTTMTHEVGHSLGLANPFGEGFHDFGDAPNRLMDAGGDRSFDERAELNGEGPARFCVGEFDYLRDILPAETAPPAIMRPGCN